MLIQAIRAAEWPEPSSDPTIHIAEVGEKQPICGKAGIYEIVKETATCPKCLEAVKDIMNNPIKVYKK